jgi:hypothetical protein
MKNKPTDRRAFLKDMLRVLAAAVLAWLGIRLASRKSDPHACIGQGLCRGCAAYRGCILPQARSLKEQGDHLKQRQAGGRG